jgi:hypothetical protein
MNNKKLKRREEKEGNNIKKRSKSYTKKEKPKKVSAERFSEAAMGGAGARDLIFHSLCGPVERKKSLTWEAQVR